MRYSPANDQIAAGSGTLRVPVLLEKTAGKADVINCKIENDASDKMTEEELCELVGGTLDPMGSPKCDITKSTDANQDSENQFYCVASDGCGVAAQYIISF
jgi:hypothetical protein